MFTTPTAGAMFGGMMPGMTAQQIANQQLVSQGINSLNQPGSEIMPMEFMEQNNKEVYFKNLNH